jgi:hypothetical protein
MTRITLCQTLLVALSLPVLGGVAAADPPPQAQKPPGSEAKKAPGAEAAKSQAPKVEANGAKPEKQGPAAARPDMARGPRGPHESAVDNGAHGKAGGRDGAGEHGAHHASRSALHQLSEDLHHGKVDAKDVGQKLSELTRTRAERAASHRQELKARWGRAASLPAAHEELRHHARRMAFLDRAAIVAETDASKDKEKLTARIAALVEKENDRHERAMQRFQSEGGSASPTGAAGSAAAPAAPIAGGAP